jgi:DNA-binding MarR family transcriptional regulator
MPDSAEVSLLYLIKQVELAARSHLEDAVDPSGLTSLQYTALTVLERRPGLTSAQLARNSFVRAQTMAQMTTYLEGEGLIRRDRDPNSRRQYLLYLTTKGEEVVESLRESVEQIEQQMLSGLTEREVRQLRASLRACRQALGGGDPH